MRQFKPIVAQLKSQASAQGFKGPIAPPVYRPQPVPKVLQTKSCVSAPTPRPLIAPPARRPDAKLIVQPKAVLPLRKPPTPPPVYRPEQKSAAVLQGKSRTHGVAQAKISPLQRQPGINASRAVVQRAAAKAAPKKFAYTDQDLDEEGSVPGQMDWEDLSGFARDYNSAASGDLESRHTQAVALDAKGHMMMYTQRWLSPMGEVPLPDVFDLEDKDHVIGDHWSDENIHAEMLAISWYLQGQAEKPVKIGVSKAVCARCSVVLSYFEIAHFTDGTVTKNWTSPWRHAGKAPPLALKGKIPSIVKNKKETPYKDADWK